VTTNVAEDPLALDRQVCFALAVANRAVLGVYRPILEPLGLTHPQYLVMLALWEQSPRSVSDLGRALQLEPATLSPLLKRLEAIGYVTRRRNTSDERLLDIALTVPPQIVERLDLPLDELTAIRDSLTRLIGAATS
jgi:DNA-binding transcriptional ArsR family regulator